MSTIGHISGIIEPSPEIVITPYTKPVIISFPIQTSFDAQKPWPRFSPMPCANCGCITKRIPFFAPSSSSNGFFNRVGATLECWPPCSLALINSGGFSPEIRDRKIALIYAAAKKLYGFDGIINAADDRSSLARFGGTYTDDEYHEIAQSRNPRLHYLSFANEKDQFAYLV